MTKLFYSYCHADEQFRDRMEKTLSLLRRNEGLNEWHDRKITPGAHIKNTVRSHIDTSEIAIFLISPDFIDSEACVEEWLYCRRLAKANQLSMVSIIVRACEWTDFYDIQEYLALPKDGTPVSRWEDTDEAWHDVYIGIKSVVLDRKKKLRAPD
ncbi:toll/interleukin-1 receptor domain-containing protein [Salinisphaera sp. Q1T1-3]|uniref:toll/interleukin-1 receptor domain-containing protein n=1 Tax=Salinisphaera sp. Q1T1-3 TaxID=2321229 RepID=UPI000E748FC9|nr:toll/interleukin-1 receptor domain-containing protein [Salinisphaera sp. Q1T1-3]